MQVKLHQILCKRNDELEEIIGTFSDESISNIGAQSSRRRTGYRYNIALTSDSCLRRDHSSLRSSGFRQAAQTPPERLNFNSGVGSNLCFHPQKTLNHRERGERWGIGVETRPSGARTGTRLQPRAAKDALS